MRCGPVTLDDHSTVKFNPNRTDTVYVTAPQQGQDLNYDADVANAQQFLQRQQLQQTPLTDEQSIQQLATGVTNFGIPNICSLGITARAGLAGGRLSFGVDANTRNGLRAASGARVINLGGVQGSISMKGKSVSATVSAPIFATPLTVGDSTSGQNITAINVGRNLKGTNLQAYANISTFADPNCR